MTNQQSDNKICVDLRSKNRHIIMRWSELKNTNLNPKLYDIFQGFSKEKKVVTAYKYISEAIVAGSDIIFQYIEDERPNIFVKIPVEDIKKMSKVQTKQLEKGLNYRMHNRDVSKEDIWVKPVSSYDEDDIRIDDVNKFTDILYTYEICEM